MKSFGISNMDFRKKIKLRIICSILLVILGALTAVFTLYSTTEYTSHVSSFSGGFYVGLGFGLIGAGCVTIIKNYTYLKNEVKFKAAEIAENDERNIFIKNKTFTVSSFIFGVILYIATIVMGFYSAIAHSVLIAVLLVFIFINLIVYTVLNKMY